MAKDWLRSEVLQEVRRRLTLEHPYFLHETPADRLESIVAKGLVPHEFKVKVPAEVAALGYPTPSFGTCLGPINAPRVEGSQLGPQMLLAIQASDLPDRFTPDWTWDYVWTIATYAREHSGSEVDHILRSMNNGSVFVYDVIPAEKLHVMTIGDDESEPSRWPRLVDVTQATIRKRPRTLLWG